jgi:hypothetical protein
MNLRSEPLNAEKILSELKTERDRLGRAIEALEGGAPRRTTAKAAKAAAPAPASTGKKRGRLTAAGRKRLSEAMKRRWAERRKKS